MNHSTVEYESFSRAVVSDSHVINNERLTNANYHAAITIAIPTLVTI